MYYIGTKTQFIATRPDNEMYITKNINEARLYSTAQRAANALVTLPRKFYNDTTGWRVKEIVDPEPIEEVETTTTSPVTVKIPMPATTEAPVLHSTGRPRVKIPDNWEEVITKYKSGEITATKAIELTNLKTATFYRMLKRNDATCSKNEFCQTAESKIVFATGVEKYNKFSQLVDSLVDIIPLKQGCLTELNGELSVINEKICDLEHYIELCQLDDQKAAKACMMLKDARLERRKIKDTIMIAEELFKNCNLEGISKIKRAFANRHYEPRHLHELFE